VGKRAVLLIAVAVTLGVIAYLGGRPPEDRRVAAPAAGPDKLRIEPPRVPERVASTDPALLLFLPVVNRSAHCIHVTRLRGIDQTLAAFAAAVLGAKVVDADLAGELGRELGILASVAPSGVAELGRTRADQAARRVGAGTIVWTELHPDLRLTVHALDVGDGTQAAVWDGAAVQLDADVHRSSYDAPRALLAAMLTAGRFRAKRISFLRGDDLGEVPPASRAELEGAWEALRSGNPAAIAQAQRVLGQLLVTHPGVADAWSGIALAHVLRALLSSSFASNDLLREGANPARHVARLFDVIPARSREALAVVDFLHLEDERSQADALEVLGKSSTLPLAPLLFDWRAPFRRAPAAAASAAQPFEELLARLVKEGRKTVAAQVLELPEKERHAQLGRHPYLIRILQYDAKDRTRWSEERAWSDRWATEATAEVLEQLRGLCLGEDLSGECLAALRVFFGAYRLSAFGDAIAIESQWQRQFGQLRRQLDSAVPVEKLPALPVFREDRAFARQWALARNLIDLSNAVLARREQVRGGVGEPFTLVTGWSRRQIARALDVVLQGAALPAHIGGVRRAQWEEAEPYLQALNAFTADAPLLRLQRAAIHEAAGRDSSADREYADLVELDPYLSEATEEAAYFTTRDGNGSNPESSRAPVVERLSCLVPRTEPLARRLADALEEIGRADEAATVLEQQLQRLPSVPLSLALDDLRDRLGTPLKQRLATLSALTRDGAQDEILTQRVAELQRLRRTQRRPR